MSRLPWFPFYVDDFLASPKVRRMDAEDVGVYLLLLLEQWQTGPIPEGSEEELAGVMRTHCDRIADVLHDCFELRKGGWVNTRLLSIEAEQLAKSAKARKAAKARWDKASDADALRTDMRTQSGRNAIQNQIQSTSGAAGAAPEKGASWASEACGIWSQVTEGTAPGGRIGKALKPLVAKHGKHQVLAAFEHYLTKHREEDRLQFANPQDFASRYGYYANGAAPEPQEERGFWVHDDETFERFYGKRD